MIISNDASLSGNLFPITNQLAPSVDGHRCLSPLMCKAKAHLQYGQDIIGSVRLQQQPQQQSHVSFSASGVIRGYHVPISKNMDASCRRKTNNGKRTRKRTRLIRFERGNVIEIRNGIMFDFYPELPHFIQMSTTLLTRFPRYRKRSILWELVEVVYNNHFSLFSLSFLHLALLQDSFHRRFLIMCHISIVAS